MTIKIREITGSCLHASTVRCRRSGVAQSRGHTAYPPHKDEKMAAINTAQAQCSQEHPVFYEDKVDIHLNPKIDADWQKCGQQKRVVTPGQNEKYYVAGALHSGTGRVSYVGSGSKGSALFISLLYTSKSATDGQKTSH